MSQGFRLRFDQLRESDPTAPPAPEALNSQYEAGGAARNVCFVWPDGRRVFFNYAYLVAAAFEPQGETNLIRLTFAAQDVLLRGYGLQALYTAFFEHLPRVVYAIEARYALTAEADKPVVVAIQVQPKVE